jgi:hypothetical protein
VCYEEAVVEVDMERRVRREKTPPREAKEKRKRSHREKSGRELGLGL